MIRQDAQLRPVQAIDELGHAALLAEELPPESVLLDLYRAMVVGRRFDAQATAFARQGKLAVYPSSRGQEACQVGVVRGLRGQDWLLPTYRDCVAAVTRGVDPVEVLTLMRGDWHCGYDPHRHRVTPLCTPLATNAPHAVGIAHAARYRKDDSVALVMLGDGATSEGDAHAAFTMAGVWRAPVVFFVQNNGYAISVPLEKQTAAKRLADKAVGYGIAGVCVDGNDAAAVYLAVRDAVARGSAGDGPTLIEAVTYRMAAHTNADDDSRYRDSEEVARWLARDPIARLDSYLASVGALEDAARASVHAEAEAFAGLLRERMTADVAVDPADLTAWVYASSAAWRR